MPYLVDGHNLIPKIEGLSLDLADDELQLVALLQAFCRRKRTRMEVYFDNAPPGSAGRRNFGPVTAHFVRQGRTADAAIRDRLARLGRTAPNWTVVSSDREVQRAARAVRAVTLPSERFATELGRPAEGQEPPPGSEKGMSPAELQDWLDLFAGEGEGQQD
jgi:predicted RNA-binding protein with PIN domain